MSSAAAARSDRDPVALVDPFAGDGLALRFPRAARIGLLGGSFNPAHGGHLAVSLEALKRLGLDRVIWLVSPQNPLKPVAGMAPLAARVAAARRLARHPRLAVSTVEARLGTRHTAALLARLTGRYPAARFVWLMGADNLATIHRWRDWRQIFALAPVAVFDRPGYARTALNGPAAQRFARARLGAGQLASLADHRPPAWGFIRMRLDPTSATAIRAARPGS